VKALMFLFASLSSLQSTQDPHNHPSLPTRRELWRLGCGWVNYHRL